MSIKSPQFKSLPPELQSHILSQDPDTLRKSLTLSKRYVPLVGKTLCMGNITKNLVRSYLLEQTPRIFGVKIDLEPPTYVIFTLTNINKTIGTQTDETPTIEPVWNLETSGSVVQEQGSDSFKQFFGTLNIGDNFTANEIADYLFDQTDQLVFDIVTGYKIYSKIPGCADWIVTMVENWRQAYFFRDKDFLYFSENNPIHVLTWYSELVTLFASVFNLEPEILNSLGQVEINYTFKDGEYTFDRQSQLILDKFIKNVNVLRQKIPKLFEMFSLYV